MSAEQTPFPSPDPLFRGVSDADYDEMRKVASARTIVAIEAPTVLRLLDLAERADLANERAKRWKVRCDEARATVERVRALAEEWEADDEESLNRFGQHLMGGSVLTCAEHLRAALDPKETP